MYITPHIVSLYKTEEDANSAAKEKQTNTSGNVQYGSFFYVLRTSDCDFYNSDDPDELFNPSPKEEPEEDADIIGYNLIIGGNPVYPYSEYDFDTYDEAVGYALTEYGLKVDCVSLDDYDFTDMLPEKMNTDFDYWEWVNETFNGYRPRICAVRSKD